MPELPDLMTTKEVADYLRIKERRVYELLRLREIPSTRVTGKWLFPKAAIDLWLARGRAEEGANGEPPPPVIAGSHDPLLEWATRESDCGLALLSGGSLQGLSRFGEGKASVAGLHLLDPDSGDYNLPIVRESFGQAPVVLIEWAKRRQGLVLAKGNPLGIAGLQDLARPDLRLLRRQAEAGSRILFSHLLSQAGLDPDALGWLTETPRSELDLGLAILEGRGDVGLAIEAVAKALKLDFLPLAEERYDLLLRRRDYFEPPMQRLFGFARSPAFAARAAAMGGYDVGDTGRVRFNGA